MGALMCYEVYILTDYPVNLAERSSTLVRFEKIIDSDYGIGKSVSGLMTLK